MGLLQSSAFEYFKNKKQWDGSEGTTNNSIPRSKFTIPSTFAYTPNNISEFRIEINEELQPSSNYSYSYIDGVATLTFTARTQSSVTTTLTTAGELLESDLVELILNESNLGDYRYISLKNIVSNFMIGYVGDGKLINTVKRSEVLFQAKRCIQEFNYDIGRVEKIQEFEVPPSLSIAMPQDYVNYVRFSWVDNAGIEHMIYPSKITSRPSHAILQDSDYDYLFSANGDLLITEALTQDRFSNFDVNNLSGSLNSNDYWYNALYHGEKISHLGGRYGLEPELAQENGVFIVDEVNGKIGFSSNLKDKLITFKYISDGLGTDKEMKIHKLAEDAVYKSILFNLLSTRAGIQEFVINRYRKERRAAMRNAKIRLSNLKIGEITQVMKGKSKQIK